MNTNTSTHTPLTDLIQIGKILFTSGLFKDLANEEQAIARILRGQELGIPPVASLTDESTILPLKPSNARQISNLLNELGITNLNQRRAVATNHLGGRKAADLSTDELEDVISAIREAYAPRQEEVTEVETVIVGDDDDGETEPIQIQEPVSTPATVETSNDDEPTDARAAISAALDRAGITDVDGRQRLVKQQLMAIRRRKVETLTTDELATVVEGIAAAA
jgi:hypothetical protein